MAKNANKSADPVQEEVQDIKRLLVLQLMRDGASQGEIAAALGVSQPSVSRMFPKMIAAVKKASKNVGR